jgi:hypothetical protein
MKFIYLSLCFLFFATTGAEAQSNRMSRIRVAEGGHSLMLENGEPFFWLGDTGWELFHRLTFEEIKEYILNRKNKGFNVIQAVVLAEMEGIKSMNRYSQLPFTDLNSLKPNERYFELIDAVIQFAAEQRMYIALLPTWGDKVTSNWGAGPVIFDKKKSYTYAKWIGARYQFSNNIIWMLGGDRPPMKDSADWRPIWREMARGIQEGTGYNAFITYHTWGGDKSTSQMIHEENWLNMNTMQSGHGGGHDVSVWEWVQRDFKMPSPKPTIDLEPNYEDHPVNPWPKWDPANGYFDDYDVRKQTYRSVFAGACGVTYGHHSVWQFYDSRQVPINYPKMPYQEALDRPGAFHMGHLKNLMESRPFINRVFDNSIIIEGQGSGPSLITAFRGGDNSYAMLYMPKGTAVTINTSFIKNTNIMAWWFEPTSGMMRSARSSYRNDTMKFIPPVTGFGHDWVLVLDDPDFRYPPPGRKKFADYDKAEKMEMEEK